MAQLGLQDSVIRADFCLKIGQLGSNPAFPGVAEFIDDYHGLMPGFGGGFVAERV